MGDLSSYDQRNLFGADLVLAGLLEPDDLCSPIKKEISPLVRDSDFEEMYKDGGRPPVSPRLLILTLLMQFLEKLPDRAASWNLKFRLDWKIAFELPLDFAGIHPTTLVYFRNRLIENEKACLLFDTIVEHLKGCGLIKKGGKQRIDSTHIIGCVRELSRVELFHETLRLFCLDVIQHTDRMDQNLITLHEKYVDKISIHGVSEGRKKEFIENAGVAMKAFISWGELSNHRDAIEGMEHFKTLKAVFEQNFTDKGVLVAPELIPISTGKGHISSPHEIEASYANKGKKGWLGYKGQVVETVSSEVGQNFITHIDTEESTNFDGDSVPTMIEELGKKDIAPAELYGDTHYNSAPNIEGAKAKSI
ncbi:MAG: transposase [Deltaproteobacteria bacterium]|nr:transposase [Deltaproteobacteria bacterium]